MYFDSPAHSNRGPIGGEFPVTAPVVGNAGSEAQDLTFPPARDTADWMGRPLIQTEHDSWAGPIRFFP